eukprot:g2453.t1
MAEEPEKEENGSSEGKTKAQKKKEREKRKKAAKKAAEAAASEAPENGVDQQEKTTEEAAPAKPDEAKAVNDEEDGSDDEKEERGGGAEAGKKKKKKKKKKKGGAGGGEGGGGGGGGGAADQKGEAIRNLGDFKLHPKQTRPCTVPVSQLFKGKPMPVGEIQNHPGDFNTYRITSEEKRALDRMDPTLYEEMREASEVHRQVRQDVMRQVRQDVMRWIRPGLSLTEIAQRIENGTKSILPADGMKRGWGFPTGLSINHCAAHFTPNAGDKNILQKDDVMKVDFGTHIGGRIIDCAFTVAFNPIYDPLLESVKDATNTGIKEAGIDVRLGDIGAAIQEVMESYE